MLRKWSELPEDMRNDSVREYYEILSKKKSALRVKRMADVFLVLIKGFGRVVPCSLCGRRGNERNCP